MDLRAYLSLCLLGHIEHPPELESLAAAMALDFLSHAPKKKRDMWAERFETLKIYGGVRMLAALPPLYGPGTEDAQRRVGERAQEDIQALFDDVRVVRPKGRPPRVSREQSLFPLVERMLATVWPRSEAREQAIKVLALTFTGRALDGGECRDIATRRTPGAAARILLAEEREDALRRRLNRARRPTIKR